MKKLSLPDLNSKAYEEMKKISLFHLPLTEEMKQRLIRNLAPELSDDLEKLFNDELSKMTVDDRFQKTKIFVDVVKGYKSKGDVYREEIWTNIINKPSTISQHKY